MKDYSKMSDFEINKAVAINVGGYQGHVEHMKHGVKESDRNSHGMFYFERDYCNNPSDAWPIMDANKIGLAFVNGEWRASSVLRGYHEFSCGNALRSAMIVYLMMNGAR